MTPAQRYQHLRNLLAARHIAAKAAQLAPLPESPAPTWTTTADRLATGLAVNAAYAPRYAALYARQAREEEIR